LVTTLDILTIKILDYACSLTCAVYNIMKKPDGMLKDVADMC